MAQSTNNNSSLHGMADLSNQLSQHSRNAVDTSLRASDVMSEDRIATDIIQATTCRIKRGVAVLENRKYFYSLIC